MFHANVSIMKNKINQSITLVILILSVNTLNIHPYQHQHDHCHHSIAFLSTNILVTGRHHLYTTMAEADNTLSGAELASRLFSYVNDVLGDERKYINEIIKTERDHTTVKFSRIVESYNTKLNTTS